MEDLTAPAAATAVAIPFPSCEWFERLASLMREQRERFRKIGFIDCSMHVTIIDGGPGGEPWHCQLTFEELDVTAVRAAAEPDARTADFVVETDVATWREMVESIADGGGRPDLDHTLNRLSLAGTPIRIWGEDPLGRDMFFRFNQTLQQFVNNCAAFRTHFPVRAAA